jgi:hypothetical protein
MRRNVLLVGGAVVALVIATAGWLVLQAASKDANLVRPGDVPQCGPAWRSVEAAKPSAIYNELHGVAAVAPDDVWAVGTLGEESAALTLVEHWDGEEWRHLASPNVEGFSNHLYGVAALAASDVWAVGAHHNGTDLWLTTAMHWDGQVWKIVPTQNVGPISSLNGVGAIAADDVWAVGESSTGSKGQGTQALVMHWDGSVWRIVDGGVRLQNGTLSSVAATSRNDVWAAGSYSDKSGTVARPLFGHWDGKSWKQVEADGNGTIWSISALSSTDVWAAGNFGPQSVAMHWDGSAWKRVPTPNVGTGNNSLNGIVAIAPDNMWAVGSGYVGKADVATAMHWDGKEWKVMPAVTLGQYSDILWGVSAAPGGDLWAVGAYIADELGNNAPVVERYSDPCGR